MGYHYITPDGNPAPTTEGLTMDFDYDGPADHYDDFPPEDAAMLVIAGCVRCGGTAVGHPDTIPSVWINITTRSPLRPDGTNIKPGEPGTTREPVCGPCRTVLTAAVNRSVLLLDLFPHARIDLINPPDTPA